MKSVLYTLSAVGLATVAQAFTQPKSSTWGPLLMPDLQHPVTQGQTFTVTWDPQNHPTDGVTVSLVLCKGPSTNCVTASTAIVEGVPAGKKSYDWAVPCDLAVGTQNTDTGYGMLVIVDGTGEFQYSTQFSVLANSKCSGSGSTTTTTASTKPSTMPTSSKNGTGPYYISGGATWGEASSTTTAVITDAHRSSGPWSDYSSTTMVQPTGSVSTITYSTAAPVTTTSVSSSRTASATNSLVSQFNAAGKLGANAAGAVAAAFAVMLL